VSLKIHVPPSEVSIGVKKNPHAVHEESASKITMMRGGTVKSFSKQR
jgi:hypothetical protein